MVDKFMCCAIIVSGLFSLSNCNEYDCYPEVGKSYKFYNHAVTFGEAYRHCKQDNASLAAPMNGAEVKILTDIFGKYPQSVIKEASNKDLMYVGLHYFFTYQDIVSTLGDPVGMIYHDWAKDEPYDNRGMIVFAMYRHGTLSNRYPFKKYPFICERKIYPLQKRVKPQNAYSYVRELRKSYRLHTDPREWGIAQTICDAEGGHLAIITSKAEEKYLVSLLNDPKNKVSYLKHADYFAFIGFHDLFLEGYYITTKDEELFNNPYINWTPGQPDGNSTQNCGGLSHAGGIGDYNCTMPSVYICEKS